MERRELFLGNGCVCLVQSKDGLKSHFYERLISNLIQQGGVFKGGGYNCGCVDNRIGISSIYFIGGSCNSGNRNSCHSSGSGSYKVLAAILVVAVVVILVVLVSAGAIEWLL